MNPFQRLRRFGYVLGVVCLCAASLFGHLFATSVQSAGTVEKVVVSLAGYSANDYKTALVIASDRLTDEMYQVYYAEKQVASGRMTYHGLTWGRYVYTVDFSSVTVNGSPITIRSNGVSSYPFAIHENIWAQYLDEMVAFYRIQRASVATSDALPDGYTDTPLSPKGYHGAGHLDDAMAPDRSKHYDLTGGWYDAGDYGKYGGNQWVGGQIALAYLRHANSPLVRFDRDTNGVPDLLDEAKFGALYALKFVDTFNGAFYNISNNAGFVHPEDSTDNISGTSDDRVLGELSVGGSAKAAGMLAASARAFKKANLDAAFVRRATRGAITAYNYAYANQQGNEGSYQTIGGIVNSLLWAEVQLYLLTNDSRYAQRASKRIDALTERDVTSTNYWDLRPISLAEFYPVAPSGQKAKIKQLLKSRVEYFMSTADDTPYGVLNEFSNFGVNEPHVSYLGDLLRYYELFGDAAVLRAIKQGLYWVFGANPWNISWVSGIGANHVKFLHTRLDDEAYSTEKAGIVQPGAMVSGPNIKDTKDKRSVSPWYQDRPLWQDDTQQWRYNEHSISIQIGLLYSIVGLASLNTNPSGGAINPVSIPITSPQIGDYVTDKVRIFAQPAETVSSMAANNQSMRELGGVYTTDINVDGVAPYENRRVVVQAVEPSGAKSSSITHFTVAPPLPSPGTQLLYDDFGMRGTWGSVSWGWPNWYNQDGGTGIFEQTMVEGRSVGKFAQAPDSPKSMAKFEPWKDTIDVSGYRYLEVTVKNPGYSNVRARFYIEAPDQGIEISGWFIEIPTTWTTLRFDLDQFPWLNKTKVHLTIWVQNGTGYGEFYIDDITYTNQESGTPPTLTKSSVSPTIGSEWDTFEFNTTYADRDNQKPFAVQVVIDGIIHDMAEVDPGDTNYVDGKAYRYRTRLVPGNHQYFFRTTDTSSQVVKTSTYEAPNVRANLALNKKVSASGECHSNEGPRFAVDSVPTTKWCAGKANDQLWLQVDLGAQYTMGEFVIQHAGAGGEDIGWNTRDFAILVSSDEKTWSQVVTVTGNTANLTAHRITPQQARYVRLAISTPTSTGDTAARIYEFEVYGP